ncbi:hypothetical protein PN497_18800 [Sphaerospermopsis kisseleviana CS-549]|uniref:PIN domain-containing protein n=1 Tax=Sphaerospermopsis kisseleviana CS-549 TaxID=3021783 RepID=A0ABT4ZXK1_9CYAN|nr:hypothetical protein [Sphaerospermopsis kisseleviana]MDB9443392.1 hypothetical protein [Sphaerospermopsis kisseleviana CS-549]BAZ81603.1 hypothetical protein NIES73_28710 [Sphaerospermopsis kisseleviana NIES-73]
MSNNRDFLDTSFIIALINERDQYHHIANDLANYYDNSFLSCYTAKLYNPNILNSC